MHPKKPNNPTSRTLKPGQLRRRYKRLRAAWSLEDQLDDEYCYMVDERWDEWNPPGPFDFLLSRAVNAILFPPDAHTLAPELRRASILPPEPEPPRANNPLSSSSPDLAERLLRHVQHFEQSPNPNDPQIPPCDPADHAILRCLAERLPATRHGLALALLFAPFWIRTPRTWVQPRSGALRSLMAHLFAAFPVRRFLEEELAADDARPGRTKWICWFILLGQGASLHRAARSFGWNIPKNFTRFLKNIPPGWSALEAIVWAHIHRAGGNDLEYRRIRPIEGYAIDLTEPADPAFRRFWLNTVRWLVANRQHLSDTQAHAVAEWALHVFLETRRFPLTRRSAASALRAAHAYRNALQAPYVDCSWHAHNLDWSHSDSSGKSWQFVELITARDLHEESLAMHHCVATYTARCRRGASAIVSLRLDGERLLTIEIEPSTRQIIQACGIHNRAPTKQELAILDRWHAAIAPRNAQESIS